MPATWRPWLWNCSTAPAPGACTRPIPGLRELLYYAALLHDIGIFLSFTAHHMHAHYLIRHTELLGFTDREIEIMAATAFFHRKRPTRRYPEYRNLDKESKAAGAPAFPVSDSGRTHG